MKTLISILLCFISFSVIAQDVTNNVGFTKRVRFKGLTIVKDTALYWIDGTDTTIIRMTDNNMYIDTQKDSILFNKPTNISSGGSVDTSTGDSKIATQYKVRTTDSVGTLVSGSIGSGFTAIDTARTNAVSNVTAGNGITITTEGKTKKVAGNQWTTVVDNLRLTDTTSHVAIGTADTTDFFEVNYGDSSLIEMQDTLNGIWLKSMSSFGLYNSLQVTKNGTYFNTKEFGVNVYSLGSMVANSSGLQFSNFPYVRSNVNASDSDDVVVFSQVIKSMTIKLAATTGNAATYEIISNNSGYSIDGTTYNFDGDYFIELNGNYFEAADKYAAFGANGYDTGLGDFVNINAHRENDDNLHFMVHNGAGTFHGDFTDVILKIEFYENN